MRNKRTIVKLALDLVMMLVLLLLFRTNATGMAFHEIAGLAIAGILAIHLLFNRQWIRGVTRRLFDRTLPTRTKLGFLTDALLLLSLLAIIVSGVGISHVVFSFNWSGAIWRTIHYTAAALTLLLFGIHLGLHLDAVGKYLKNIFHIPAKAAKIAGGTICALLFVFGLYSILTTEYLQWLTMPLTATQMASRQMTTDTDFAQKDGRMPDFDDSTGKMPAAGDFAEAPDANSGTTQQMPHDGNGTTQTPGTDDSTTQIPDANSGATQQLPRSGNGTTQIPDANSGTQTDTNSTEGKLLFSEGNSSVVTALAIGRSTPTVQTLTAQTTPDTGDTTDSTADSNMKMHGHGYGRGQGAWDGAAGGGNGNGYGNGNGGRNGFSLGAALWTILQFLSIAFAFAVPVYLADLTVQQKRQERLRKQLPQATGTSSPLPAGTVFQPQAAQTFSNGQQP